MIYTYGMQTELDIDWFAIDQENNIAHFASGGGEIPKSVASSVEDNEKLVDYFRSLNDLSEEFIVNPRLEEILSFPTVMHKNRYLVDFIKMANKGLYSFDRSFFKSDNQDYTCYHLVTLPKIKISINTLPVSIKNTISKTIYKSSFISTSSINIRDIK